MTLPRLLVLTDRTLTARPLRDVVAAAVDGGAPAVLLREKDLPPDDRARLADEVRAVLGEALLVLAGTGLPPGPGEGVHLAAPDAVPSPRPALLGRSCHGMADVLASADCDWVTLSPVWETATKPGYGPGLGPTGLARCVGVAPPVFALGGVTRPAEVRACRAAGAYGVAVLGAVMRAEHPDRVVSALLAAVDEA